MTRRQMTKLVHEGEYVAEVEVELLVPDDVAVEAGWAPYLSLEDAYRLDDVRHALRRGDLDAAAKIGCVFRLTPVSP